MPTAVRVRIFIEGLVPFLIVGISNIIGAQEPGKRLVDLIIAVFCRQLLINFVEVRHRLAIFVKEAFQHLGQYRFLHSGRDLLKAVQILPAG